MPNGAVFLPGLKSLLAFGGSTIMTAGTLCLPKMASRGDGPAALRAADWLSLGAAPTFAFVAALTGILGGGGHESLCSAVSHTSVLSGMAPMYMLMGVFHVAPWLKLISRWRSGARAAGLAHEEGMSRPLAEQRRSHGA